MGYCAHFAETRDQSTVCAVYPVDDAGRVSDRPIAIGTGASRGTALAAAYDAVTDQHVRDEIRTAVVMNCYGWL